MPKRIFALLSRHDRLLRLEETSADRAFTLTEEQVEALERFSPEFRERHIEAHHTGDLVAVVMWHKLRPEQAEAVRALIGHSTDPKKRRVARRAFLLGWARDIIAHGDGWDERTSKSVGAAFVEYLVRLGMFEHDKTLVGTGRRKWVPGQCRAALRASRTMMSNRAAKAR